MYDSEFETAISSVETGQGLLSNTENPEPESFSGSIAAQQKALSALSREALTAVHLSDYLELAAKQICLAVNADLCRLIQHTLNASEPLVLRAIYQQDTIPQNKLFAHYDETQATFALQQNQTIVMENRLTETRFKTARLYDWLDLRSAVSIMIQSPNRRTFGVLELACNHQRQFQPHEVEFLETAANLLGLALHRFHVERAEKNCETALNRYQDVLESSNYGVWELDLESGDLQWNDRLYTMLDLCPKSFTPTPESSGKLLHPDDYETVNNLFQAHLLTGGSYEVELRIRKSSGEYAHQVCHINITLNEQGKAVRATGMSLDITERKQAELRLKESEARFQAIANDSPFMIWMSQADGRANYFNRSWREYTGIGEDETVDWEWLIHPDEFRSVSELFMAAYAKKAPYQSEGRIRRFDGQFRWMYIVGNPRIAEDGTFLGYIGCYMDIHERKLAEFNLQESEQRFRLMADASPMHIWLLDRKGLLTYCNKSFLTFLGVTSPPPQADWPARIHPGDLPALQDDMRHFLEKPVQHTRELRLRRVDGSYRWLYSIAEPRWGVNGEFMGYVGSNMDITELKLTEQTLKIYTAKLEQSNQELEQFAVIASHDLQEPLRKIAIFGDFLKISAGESLSLECYDYIDRMQKAVVRMQVLIDDLLTMSRITRKAKPFLPMDCAQVLEAVVSDLELARRQTEGTIIIENTMTIDADQSQMRQLFQNLIGNALKFHRKNVPPIVRVNMRPVPGELCEITVSDNGIGFDEKYRKRIFLMFARLHSRESYEGTGIGLAIVQKITARHGGAITVESQPGQGSTFIIRLPIHQK